MLTIDTRRTLRRSITGTSAIALATALVSAAQAQSLSYNAPDPFVRSGSVTFQRGQTPGVEVYNVQSPTAVLDFTPSDASGTGVINFQNGGTSAIYQGTSNFTVLNRILPTDPSRAVQFNGTVRSLVNSTAGGSVWFFSPGGIIAGSTSVFDVGSLLLATGDPTGGTGTIGSTSGFSIASANGNAAVTVQPNAQISALSEGSYVALVAPVVNQNGVVRVNGSAAYVAAESASLTIDQGLFDINVAVGSDGNSGVPLTHNGSTRGPASTGAGDNHGIYMVAVPKNTAITMLIAPTGQLGFDPAASATVENGAIYLRTASIAAIQPTLPIGVRLSGPSAGGVPTAPAPASIVYRPDTSSGTHTLSSNLEAQAVTQLDLDFSGVTLAPVKSSWYAGERTTMTLQPGASLSAGEVALTAFTQDRGGDVSFTALPGSQAQFDNFLGLGSNGFSLFTQYGPNVRAFTGGSTLMTVRGATVTANGAGLGVGGASVALRARTTDGTGLARLTIDQGGQLVARATSGQSAVRVSASPFGPAPGKGGTASVVIDNGSLSADGIFVDAVGFGQGSDVRGGAADFSILAGGGDIQTTHLIVYARATADAPNPASNAIGGTARLILNDTTDASTIKADTIAVYADAIASPSVGSSLANGGAATGGAVLLQAGVNTSVETAGLLELKASALGADGILGGAGGTATSGSVQLNVSGGQVSFATASLTAAAQGGSGSDGTGSTSPGGAGGGAFAGAGVSMFASNGGSITGQNTVLDASARAGRGGNGFNSTGLAGSGGFATAANTFVGTSTNGQISLGSLTLDSRATGGDTGSGTSQSEGMGGDAIGGSANVNADAGLIQVTSLFAVSNAFGGNGFALGANGGAATSTFAGASAMNNGTLKVTGGNIDLSAEGFGGDASGLPGGATVQAGAATGGTAALFAGSGGAIDSAATGVFIDASADGGAEFGTGNVTGGIGRGGQARINANGGTIILRSEVELTADGEGGDGGGTGNAGDGIGGEARLGTFGAVGASKVEVTGDLFLDASGDGGFAEAGAGGAGLGGTPADLDNGPFDKGAYIVATGGTVSVSGVVELDASGFGGDGGAGGGKGQGGLTDVIAFGAAIEGLGTVSLDSSGQGGDGLDGAAGGAGIGGTSFFTASSGGDSGGGGTVPPGTPGSVKFLSLFLDASGQGGDGGTGLTGAAGGIGGDGFGGVANPVAQAGSGTMQLGSTVIFVQGAGGFGGDGGAALSSGGNGGAGGKGGVGTGGFTNFGTVSGPDTSVNNGSATFADVTAFVNGIGGSGGTGGTGANGGDGGNGLGGNGTLLSRGSQVSAGTVTIDASAFGGQGGEGTVSGAGGAANGGTASMLITNRFNRTERGSLAATNFSATAGALGGFGNSNGASTAGRVVAQVTKSDATLDSLSLTSFGDAPPPAGSESSIVVDAGTLTVSGSLSASVVGDLNLFVFNNGVLKADSLFLSASGSLAPPPSGGGTVTPGLIDVASSFSATFGGDFVTTSDFNLDGSLDISSGGLLQTGNIVAGGAVFLNSTGDLTTGNVTAGDGISLRSDAMLTTGALAAGVGDPELVFGQISLSGGAGVRALDINGATVFIDDGSETPSVNGIQVGDVSAETIFIRGTAGVATGDLLQRQPTFASGEGFGQLTIISAGALQTGDIDSATSVSLFSDATLAAGNIKAGDSIFAFGAAGVSAGDVTAALSTDSFVSGEIEIGGGGSITLGDIKGASVDIFSESATTIDLTTSFSVESGSPSFYIIEDDFTLPASFSDATLTIAGLNLDDRGAVLLNGAIVDNAGIFGPGTGSLVLTQGGSNEPFVFTRGNGSRDVAVTSGFVSGPNSFRIVVNDTNNGIFGELLSGVNISGGDISASVSFNVGSGASAASIQTGSITGETISVRGPGEVRTGDLRSGDFYSGIDTSFDNFLIGAVAGGDLTVGNVDAFTSVGLASRTGSINAGAITANDSVLLLAATDIRAAAITGGTGADDNIFLSNISVLETDPVFEGFETLEDFGFFDPATLADATPVRLAGQIVIGGAVVTGGFAAAAQNGIQAQSIDAPNRLLLDTGGALSLGLLRTSGAFNLVSDNAISIGDLVAGTVDLKSAQNVSTGSITATGAVTVTSGASAIFGGVISAPQISVTSRDLQLGANGRLGTAATTQLTLNAPGVSSFAFGGNGTDGGYSISGAEAQGLRAQRIDIATSGPVTIGAVTLNGSGAGSAANLVGDGARLTIDSASGIRVNGALTIANAGSGDRLTLRSGERIAVATDSGGVLALTGAGAGSLGGTLELVADTIVVASGSLLDQIAANPNFTGRNQALAAPSASPRLEGNLQANRLELDAVKLIAIQNSGSAEQAAGFTAGAGGMQIRSRAPSTASLDLFAFGRVADSSGTFRINDQVLSAIAFSAGEGSTASLTPQSAVNNCVVGGSVCEAAPVTPPLQEVIVDRIPAAIQDVVEGALSSTSDPENVAALPTIRLVTTIDSTSLRTEPVISDPVSGGGNPSLWEGSEDQDDRREDGDQPARPQGDNK